MTLKIPTIADELAKLVSPATIFRRNEPLAKHTTLRVGGPADVYVEPATEAELAAILNFCGERGVKFFILGRGSNLIVRDGGFRGVAICLAHANFSRIEIDGERLRCGAGAKLKDVAVEAKRQRRAGYQLAEDVRYHERSAAERVNARLKDEFGGRHVRVRGHAKVYCHLMFGVLALAVDQLMRLMM